MLRGRVLVPDGRFPDLPSPRLRAAAAGANISLRLQERLRRRPLTERDGADVASSQNEVNDYILIVGSYL